MITVESVLTPLWKGRYFRIKVERGARCIQNFKWDTVSEFISFFHKDDIIFLTCFFFVPADKALINTVRQFVS